MPENLANAVDALAATVEGLRAEVHNRVATERGARMRAGRRFGAMLAAVVLVGLATVGGAYLLIRQNAHRIGQNTVRVEQLVYDQCVSRNDGVARQNALIDSAIAAERRKPVPDAKRLHDLAEFRGRILDCGRRPG